MAGVLEGIPGISKVVRDFVPVVREFTRDFPELNRLMSGTESDDRQIVWAIMDAMSDFNGTPPITNYPIEHLLYRQQQSLLLRMTTCALMESVMMLQMRNHLNYSTGGTTVGINDKSPLLMQTLQYLKGVTEQMKQRVKIAFNIESIMNVGGLASEYRAINSIYAAY